MFAEMANNRKLLRSFRSHVILRKVNDQKIFENLSTFALNLFRFWSDGRCHLEIFLYPKYSAITCKTMFKVDNKSTCKEIKCKVYSQFAVAPLK